ncbi:MAG: hypothetical protein R3D98_06000 [Candidatus Krumholzibacteriia bacterium]
MVDDPTQACESCFCLAIPCDVQSTHGNHDLRDVASSGCYAKTPGIFPRGPFHEDFRGRRVHRLVDESLDPGINQPTWRGADGDGRGNACGVYLIRLKGSGGTLKRAVTVLKPGKNVVAS